MPDSVKVAESVRARFVGPVKEQVQPDGVVEASRDVEVTLPAIPKLVGSQQMEMAFLWPDGHRKTHVIRWEIMPLVHLSPSSIVIEPSGKPIEQSVTITSDDESFRITKVGGVLLSAPVEVPSAAGTTHRLTFWLDPARRGRQGFDRRD